MTWILPFDLVGAGLRFPKDLIWLFLALCFYAGGSRRREREHRTKSTADTWKSLNEVSLRFRCTRNMMQDQALWQLHLLRMNFL